MVLSAFDRTEIAGRVRVSARVSWEDCDRPAREVFLETPEPHGADLSPNPDAFLVGCLVPALYLGEARVSVRAPVCPELLENLETAMAVLHTWYGPRYRPVPIEAPARAPAEPTTPGTGLFLSGGADSLAALRRNHLRYPPGHPARAGHGFLVHGFDIGGVVERGAKYPVFDRAQAAMEAVARDAGIALVPVYTNLRHLCDERQLWLEKFFGAVLAAVGHGFAVRNHRVEIASSYDLANLAPCGSHPLLDPLYGSLAVRVRHRDVELSRLDKLRVVAGWDTAFQNLRVCLQNVPDRLNCGWCEKCVRTMTALVALGCLDRTRAFVEDDVAPELLARAKMTINHREPFYAELVAPLRARGRHDLADVIETRLAPGQGGKP